MVQSARHVYCHFMPNFASKTMETQVDALPASTKAGWGFIEIVLGTCFDFHRKRATLVATKRLLQLSKSPSP